MSEISWTRAVTSKTRHRPPAAPGELLDAVLPMLRAWLPRQRWFAGKGHPVGEVSVLSATELAAPTPQGDPGLLHLLLRVPHPVPGAPPGTADPGDCYQLLLGTRVGVPAALSGAVVGRVDGGPHDGTTVVDALHDPRLSGLLLKALATGGHVDTLRFHRRPHVTIPDHLQPRVGTAEQSNTSVVYGDSLILKVFRRVSAGTNPDLELSLALADSGSTRVPAPVAWFDTPWPGSDADGGRPTTLGLLQRFLPGSADGWELALASVPAEDFTAESFLLGEATAEVHTVLGRALPTVTLDRAGTEALAARMTHRLDAAAAAVPQLVPYRTALRGAYADLAALGGRGRALRAQRIHGDLHLGQVLRTTAGWVLLDFEGEPGRPLAERRRPQPVVRDVAAMLRSFDYAARHNGAGPEADAWAERNRTAFCAGYAAVGETDPRAEWVLMRAFEIDKAVYEVLYEARNRPSWLPIPMSAIHRLAAPVP
ncbi:phosphotransferase [Streptomyces capparidis]